MVVVGMYSYVRKMQKGCFGFAPAQQRTLYLSPFYFPTRRTLENIIYIAAGTAKGSADQQQVWAQAILFSQNIMLSAGIGWLSDNQTLVSHQTSFDGGGTYV